MREILFRGKDLDNNWYYGYYVFEPQRLFHYIVGFNKYNLINPFTLGQYTGLKDKNGTRIFEGDIILIKNSNCYDTYESVIYKGSRFITTGSFGLSTNSSLDSIITDYENTVEVAGNIYDNKELLSKH